MAKQDRQLTYSIRVSLPESAVDAVVQAQGGTPEAILQKTAQSLLMQYLFGGIMMNAHDVQALEKMIGLPIRTSADAMRAINEGAPLKDGKNKMVVTMDPAFVEPLKQYCDVSGLTLDQFVSQVWNLVVSSGMLFDVRPLGGSFHATQEDREWMDSLMGRRAYTFSEVMEKVRSLVQQPVEA